jgi:glycosyltransferase involved in cell wall biosynthesis
MTKERPFVTVIMPVRNEADFIARSLGAVLAQDYSADRLEVLVADGRSTDGTRGVVEGFARGDSRVHLVDNPGGIVATGLNAALREVRGDIVVRVDGHTEIAPDYVRACVDALERTRADNVGGRMTAVGEGAFGSAVAAATSSPFGVGGARFHYSDREEWVDTVYLGAWPREVFERIGAFDEEFVRDQDDEFNYRLRASGGRILLTPAVRSRYRVRGTPRSLFRQYFQYGYWKVRVLQKHARQMRGRQFVPPSFVACLLVAALLGPVTPLGWTILGLVAGAYAAANVIASTWTARRGSGPWRILLPVVFATLHFGYGLGFLTGLIRFAGRWGDRGTAGAAATPAAGAGRPI